MCNKIKKQLAGWQLLTLLGNGPKKASNGNKGVLLN